MESQDKKSNGKEKAYLVLALFFFVTSLALGYLLYEEKQTVKTYVAENQQLDSEKQAVESELEEMLAQYEAMETENEEMNAKIEEQKAKIEELLTKAKNNQWTIYKLKKETESLRTIMKGYIHTIDSLNTANIELMAQNEQAQKQIQTKDKELSKLSKEKEELTSKVELGAQIEALDITASGQRIKRNDVARETTRAGRTEQIKCCFTMNDNPIAEAGRKALHLRIIDPNGKVLAEAENKENLFEFEGVEGLFSAEYEVIYDNEELDVCMFWEKVNEDFELAEGIYIVEIYIDDYLAGTKELELR